jgi:hypothetical protein
VRMASRWFSLLAVTAMGGQAGGVSAQGLVQIGVPMPEHVFVVCSRLDAAQQWAELERRSADSALEVTLPRFCVNTQVIVVPHRIEEAVLPWEGFASVYANGGSNCVTHALAGRMHRIPTKNERVLLRLYFSSVTLGNGRQFMGWAVIPERPYHSAFLADPARRNLPREACDR